MKWIGLWFIILLLMLLANIAYADDPHGVVIEKSNYQLPTNNYQIGSSQAMALAVSEINPTLLSSKYQIGIGFGAHNDETAIAVGLAKRVNKSLLFSGKIANQDGDIGTSIGLNFKF